MTHTLPEATLPGPAPVAAARIAVVGIHGYGGSHVLNALALQADGRASLVGLVDPVPGAVVREGVTLLPEDLPRIYPTLDALLESVDVDIVAVATPLHTHASIAEQVLWAGADVLLEKPPVTDLADLARLVGVQRSAGGRVQVGFQSLGSHALAALDALIADGALGQLTAIGAVGCWTRDRAYWTRSAWAGHRELGGVRVADGAVSNPFAHALMTALHIAGWHSSDAIGSVEADLRRVNPIETDDTSSLRIRPSSTGAASFAGTLTCAFTLAGPTEDDPYILVNGTKGTAQLYYTADRLLVNGTGADARFGRDDLLENLIEVRRRGAELISPLERTGGFVRVIDQLASEPVSPIGESHVAWEGEGARARPVLESASAAVTDAAARQLLFRELPGLAWA